MKKIPWKPWVDGRARKAKVGRWLLEAYPAMGGGYGYTVCRDLKSIATTLDRRPCDSLPQAMAYAEELFFAAITPRVPDAR